MTGPCGHDGAFLDLRAFIEHYSESDKKLFAFTADHLEPLLRGTQLDNKSAILAQDDTLLNGGKRVTRRPRVASCVATRGTLVV